MVKLAKVFTQNPSRSLSVFFKFKTLLNIEVKMSRKWSEILLAHLDVSSATTFDQIVNHPGAYDLVVTP